MSIFRVLPTIIVCALLAGCATTGDPMFTPPAGSLVKLEKEVTARSGKRIYIQNGTALDKREVDVLRPYCQFVLDELGENISIAPDTFTVTKAYLQRRYALPGGVQYAGRAGSDATLSTVMTLSSGNQPQVTQLICSQWGELNVVGWVTIDEMKATLDGLVEIVLAQ